MFHHQGQIQRWPCACDHDQVGAGQGHGQVSLLQSLHADEPEKTGEDSGSSLK